MQVGDIAVRPDIVFPRKRVAVFIDGCFWHSCPEHGNRPKSNVSYWSAKLERNRRRDIKVTAELRSNGWEVLRIWEHVDPVAASEAIIAAIRSPERLAIST
jgi:DNA mismatch endonuclease (patch repair protein)